MANIVRDFEPELETLLLRPFDDGRFIVLVDGAKIFDKNRTNRFPAYDDDIKADLEART